MRAEGLVGEREDRLRARLGVRGRVAIASRAHREPEQRVGVFTSTQQEEVDALGLRGERDLVADLDPSRRVLAHVQREVPVPGRASSRCGVFGAGNASELLTARRLASYPPPTDSFLKGRGEMTNRGALVRAGGAALVALTACVGDFAASGSGAATAEVYRAGQMLRTQRVTVTFSTRRANYAAGGFLDLKVDNVACPLLLTGDQQIVAGRVCSMAGDAWAITGGTVAGASLVLRASRHDTPLPPVVDELRLAYPEPADAGADLDASTESDVPGADIPNRDRPSPTDRPDVPTTFLNCLVLCQRYAITCGSTYRTFCESECSQNLAAIGNRCNPEFYGLQQCASTRAPTTCNAPYLGGFSDCVSEYNAFVTCTRGS